MAFYKSVAGKDATATSTELETYISVQSEEQIWAEGGEYLPLSVWRSRGFNEEDIRTKTPASDQQHHSVLGQCYRVAIRSSAELKKRKVTRKSEVGTASRGATAAASSGLLAIENGDPDPDDSESTSDSDSSSSSSSDKKHKKKHNKSKGKKSKKSKKSKKGKGGKKEKQDLLGTHAPLTFG